MQNTKAAAAFVAAQKAFAPATKSSTNPHFKSKYADLAACVEAVLDALNAQDLALMQICHESASGVLVETIFLHASGESISGGKLHVPSAKNDPQGYGSALTYARRYSLMAACGIAPEDDDGNAASKTTAKTQKAAEQDAAAEQDPRITDAAMELIALHRDGKDAELLACSKKLPADDALKTSVWAALPESVKAKIKELKGAQK